MEQATQLEDLRPQIDTPLRIKGPANLPSRNDRLSKDDFIKINAFSPFAYSQIEKLLENQPNTWKAKKEPNVEREGASTTAIRDQTMLAFSSKRAGKFEVEASAYLSLALVYDNLGKLKKAIENYKLYLDVVIKIKDVPGQVLAWNCIGVNYMLLASPPSDAGVSNSTVNENSDFDETVDMNGTDTLSSSTAKATARKRKYIQEAINAHNEQLKIADSGGIFVGHTNLGLTYAMIDDPVNAAKHHQDALRTAIKMQSIYGQSIAVGNLGLLAMLKGDNTTARTCFEQHVQLIQALQDPEAEVNAWKLLANLLIKEENHEAAIDALHQAREIAAKNKLNSELRRIHCLIGESSSANSFIDYTRKLVL